MMREAEVTLRRRKAYARALRNAMRAIGRLEDEAVRSILSDLRSARSAFLAILADLPSDFDQWNAPHALRAIEEAAAHYRGVMAGTLAERTDRAWTLGMGKVISGAQASGVAVSAPAFEYGVDRTALEFAQSWNASLIQGETDEVVKAVSREIRLAKAGGQTKAQLIQRVQQTITKPLRFGARERRAEAIVRTELGRIHNSAQQATREKFQAENVVIRKGWLHTGQARVPRVSHMRMSGTTVDTDQRFPWDAAHVGDKWALPRNQWPLTPQDPVLPAHESVNCHCTTLDIFDQGVLDMDELASELAYEVTR